MLEASEKLLGWIETYVRADAEKIRAYVKENGLEDGGALPCFNFGVDIPVLKGPFDFTFTSGKSTPPINYA